MASAKMAAWDAEFAPFADLIPILKSKTGRNFTEDPVLFETLHDLFKSQVSKLEYLSIAKASVEREFFDRNSI